MGLQQNMQSSYPASVPQQTLQPTIIYVEVPPPPVRCTLTAVIFFILLGLIIPSYILWFGIAGFFSLFFTLLALESDPLSCVLTWAIVLYAFVKLALFITALIAGIVKSPKTLIVTSILLILGIIGEIVADVYWYIYDSNPWCIYLSVCIGLTALFVLISFQMAVEIRHYLKNVSSYQPMAYPLETVV